MILKLQFPVGAPNATRLTFFHLKRQNHERMYTTVPLWYVSECCSVQYYLVLCDVAYSCNLMILLMSLES